MNVERRLTDKIGDAGKRLHTGRSRNDQVATDIRLWLRAQIDAIVALIAELQTSLLDLAEQHADTVMPGFTHLQVAQTGNLWPPHAGLRGNAGPRRRAHERLPQTREPACRWAPPRWPAPPSRSTATTPRSCWVLTTCATTRWTPCPTVTSPSNSPPRASLVMVHLSRLSEELILWMSPARRLHRYRRPLLHRQLHHAAEEKPGRAGAGTRQIRPCGWPPDRTGHPDEGAATGLQQGQPGRQRAAVRHRRHADRHAAHLRRHDARHHREAGCHACCRAAGLCHRHRPGPTTW